MRFTSKLPNINTHIFSYMSGLSNQYGAINLSQGFPNFEPSQKLQNLVDTFIKAKTNQYAPMLGLPVLRQRISEKMNLMYDVTINPDTEITIAVGATEAIFNSIAAFVYPGDEVILIEPCYDCYRPSIEVMGGIPIIYKMSPPDYKIDWQELGKLVNSNTRMICISSPNNPTGTVLDKEDMQQLIKLVKGTDILIMSDEVYEHMVFDGATHESPMKYPELRERTFSMFSFGKTYHITGWKVGYCIAPPELSLEIRRLHQNNIYSVSHPLQAAIAEFMKDPSEYTGLAEFYQQKRDLFLDSTSGSKFKALPCRGSYFQLFDYSNISEEDDFSFCERLVKEYGVAAIPVSYLYSDKQDDKVIRFCFAKTDDVLMKAGELLKVI